MSQEPAKTRVAGVIVLGSIVIAVGRFLLVEPEQANRALGQGIWLVIGSVIIAAGIQNSERVAEFIREKGWQYWLCFGVALFLGVTGLVDMRAGVRGGVEMCMGGMEWLDPFEWGNARADKAGFPANLVYILLTLVIGIIFVVIAVGFGICALPLAVLDWIALKGGIFAFAANICYALMLAWTLQLIVFPLIRRVTERFWPAVAAVVNDVFIGVPSGAGAELEREGRTTVVQRKPWQLVIAVVAGVIAILAHFIRTG